MSMAFDKLVILLRWGADLDAAAAEVVQWWTVLGMDEFDHDKSDSFVALKKRLAEVMQKGRDALKPQPPSAG